MVAPGIKVEGGIDIGPGISMGLNAGGGGPSGSNGIVGFSEMTSSGNQNAWIEDQTATMLGNGFILNATSGGGVTTNGIAINYLTADNLTFFSTYGTGSKTIQWAAGSTITTPMTVNLTQNGGTPELVFFMNSVTSFPATFIFPVTFS
jgi:hypothetical protein